MKFFIMVVFMFAIVACSQTPEIVTENREDNPGGMAKVKYSGFDKAYVDSDLGLSSYSALMFAPLDTSNVEVESPEIQQSRKSDWDFSGKDAAQMSEAYEKAIERTFKKENGMALVKASGPGVILVKSKLTRFAPTTPKFNSIDRTSRSKFYARSSADFTLQSELVDSQTNQVLATIIENREMGDNLTMEEITISRYALDVRRGFERWAINFKESINKLRQN